MPRVAAGELRACGPLRRRGPVADRVEAWHVEALVRLADGQPSRRPARCAQWPAPARGAPGGAGASDLRAAVSEIGVEIARLGLRIALADDAGLGARVGRAAAGSALRLAPVTPSPSPALRDLDRAAPRQRERSGGPRCRDDRAAPCRRRPRSRIDSKPFPSRDRPGPLAGEPSRHRRHPSPRELAARSGDAGAGRVHRARRPDHRTDARRRQARPPRARRGGPGPRGAGVAAFRAGRLVRRGQTPGSARLGAAGARAAAEALEERLIAPLAETIGDAAGDRADRVAAHPAVVDAADATRASGDRRAVGGDMAARGSRPCAGEADGARCSSPGRGCATPPRSWPTSAGCIRGPPCSPGGEATAAAVMRRSRAPRSPISPATGASAQTARCSPRSSSRTAS